MPWCFFHHILPPCLPKCPVLSSALPDVHQLPERTLLCSSRYVFLQLLLMTIFTQSLFLSSINFCILGNLSLEAQAGSVISLYMNFQPQCACASPQGRLIICTTNALPLELLVIRLEIGPRTYLINSAQVILFS